LSTFCWLCSRAGQREVWSRLDPGEVEGLRVELTVGENLFRTPTTHLTSPQFTIQAGASSGNTNHTSPQLTRRLCSSCCKYWAYPSRYKGEGTLQFLRAARSNAFGYSSTANSAETTKKCQRAVTLVLPLHFFTSLFATLIWLDQTSAIVL